LVGTERQKQEEIIKVAMGSIYQGEALYIHGTDTWHLQDLFTAGLDTVRVSMRSGTHPIDSHIIPDCILDALPLSCPGPFPASAETSAGRARRCNRKRPVTYFQ
jgi:hypothetical protein